MEVFCKLLPIAWRQALVYGLPVEVIKHLCDAHKAVRKQREQDAIGIAGRHGKFMQYATTNPSTCRSVISKLNVSSSSVREILSVGHLSEKQAMSPLLYEFGHANANTACLPDNDNLVDMQA